MADWREDRVRSAVEGRNPTVLAELAASYAVIGDVQFLPGYSLALTKTPGVDPGSRWAEPETALGPDHDELRSILTAEVLSRRDAYRQ